MGIRSPTGTIFSIQLRDNYSRMEIYNYSAFQTIPMFINQNEWHHIAIAHNGSEFTAYVDGLPVVTKQLAIGDEVLLDLGGLIHMFWYHRGFWTEGRTWLRMVDDPHRQINPVIQARALRSAALLAYAQNDCADATGLYEQSLHLYHQADYSGILLP